MAIDPDNARALLQAIDQPVFMTDLQGTIQSVNPAFEQTTGYASEEAVGEPAGFLEAQESSTDAFDARVETLEGEEAWEGLVTLRRPDGGVYRVFQTVVPLIGEDDGRQGYAVHNLNLTRLINEREDFQHQALQDELTGLPNRTLVFNRIQQALDQLDRDPDEGFTLILLDLDEFRRITNSLGHEVGDEIIATVADRLDGSIRPGDTAGRSTTARFGSDEFVLLLENTHEPSHAQAIIERLLDAVRQPMTVAGHELHLDATAGIVFSTPGYESPQTMIRDAETAMHRAKNQGKDHAFFTDTMQDELLHQFKIEEDLRRALGDGEFQIHYQPIVSVPTRELQGFEALIRWDHPEEGFISPGEFLPEAERSGLIVPLGRWVLDEAVGQLAAWRREAPFPDDLMMSINHSPSELAEPDFLDAIEGTLTKKDVPRGAIHLEFTETTVARNVERMDERIHELSSLGLSLCVDDFGSGYSAVERLFRWPIDHLKIDRTFIDGMAENDQQRHLTRGILEFARHNELHVIAEGVETEAEHDLLEEWECPAAQGFFYARPMAASEVEAYLESTTSD